MHLLHLLAAARARRRDQWRSQQAILALREARLRRLGRAAARTPHYAALFRQLRLDPQRLAEPGQLARLPPLEKTVLHAAEENRLLAEPRERLFPVTTSGSTGEPTLVYRSHRDQAEVSALWARVLHAYGHRPLDRQVNISTGRAVARHGPVALLRRIGLLPEIRHLSSFDPVDRQIEVLRELRPQTFSAYAISLELIAEALVERGIRDIRPRLVFSAAMPLSERGRRLAEQAFGVAPFDVYVSAELGTLGWECPVDRGTLHLNDDMQIVEILDDRDQPLPDGETGQVVVTQLGCLAQPLLRYRLGDLAARVAGRCPCGRGLARLSPVQGRTRHVIRTPDGRLLYGMMVSTVVKPFQEVRRWQLRQTSPDSLRLLVVPLPTWRPSVAGAIRNALNERFGPGLTFEVVPVDDIPLLSTGKLQTIVPLPETGTLTSAPGTESGTRSSP
jgi:phenylacetate-CoA ligase